MPLFRQGGLNLLCLQRVLSGGLVLHARGPDNGHGGGAYDLRLLCRGCVFRHCSDSQRQQQGHHQDAGGQCIEPLSGNLPPSFLCPDPPRLLHALLSFFLPSLCLPAGLPAADLLQLVLPAVAGLHGPDTAFQVVHVCRHTLVLLHCPAVFFRFPLAHFLVPPPAKNLRLTS